MDFNVSAALRRAPAAPSHRPPRLRHRPRGAKTFGRIIAAHAARSSVAVRDRPDGAIVPANEAEE